MRRVLVPLRYPIMSMGERTIRKALELGKNNTSLIFYHVNLLYEESTISAAKMRREIERLFPEIKEFHRVSYEAEDSYLLEESLLRKISISKADAVIMGKTMIPRWRKFLSFWRARSITEDIKHATKCNVIVVE